jgi:hypothetical protein
LLSCEIGHGDLRRGLIAIMQKEPESAPALFARDFGRPGLITAECRDAA